MNVVVAIVDKKRQKKNWQTYSCFFVPIFVQTAFRQASSDFLSWTKRLTAHWALEQNVTPERLCKKPQNIKTKFRDLSFFFFLDVRVWAPQNAGTTGHSGPEWGRKKHTGTHASVRESGQVWYDCIVRITHTHLQTNSILL
jgi:hypothetical protein